MMTSCLKKSFFKKVKKKEIKRIFVPIGLMMRKLQPENIDNENPFEPDAPHRRK